MELSARKFFVQVVYPQHDDGVTSRECANGRTRWDLGPTACGGDEEAAAIGGRNWRELRRRVDERQDHARGSYARKLTNSLLTRSAWVHRTPCGPPGNSTNLTFLIIFACLLDVASGGRMRSASPCRMSVGTLFLGMSLRTSSIQQSTHATVPIAEAPAATFQLSSRTRSLTSFPPVTS